MLLFSCQPSTRLLETDLRTIVLLTNDQVDLTTGVPGHLCIRPLVSSFNVPAAVYSLEE